MSCTSNMQSFEVSNDTWNVVSGKKYTKKNNSTHKHVNSDTKSRCCNGTATTAIVEKPPVFLNLKLLRLDINNTAIHPKVYNYIANVFKSNSDNDIIPKILPIGVNHNDKVVALANLFFICVRKDRTSLMQKIIDCNFLKNPIDRHFVVNAYDRGFTPIMRAAYNGSSKAIKLLLFWGADKNATNAKGETVYGALESGLNELDDVMKILEGHKFAEIRNFLDRWEQNVENAELCLQELSDPTSSNTEKISDNLDESSDELNIKKFKIITKCDDDQDYLQQISNLLVSYIENCNTSQLALLIEDINTLSSTSHELKEKIMAELDEYMEILQDEFSDEYEQLNL